MKYSHDFRNGQTARVLSIDGAGVRPHWLGQLVVIVCDDLPLPEARLVNDQHGRTGCFDPHQLELVEKLNLPDWF